MSSVSVVKVSVFPCANQNLKDWQTGLSVNHVLSAVELAPCLHSIKLALLLVQSVSEFCLHCNSQKNEQN